MKKTCIGWAWVVTATLTAPGCLVKDVTQTVYLEPSGAVTWVVLEKDVRSDGHTAQDRAHEEADYFDAVATGQHPVALAFSRLDPTRLRTAILRAERPYTVLTEARFAGLEQLMGLFASKLGTRATSTLERHKGGVTWTLTVYDDSNSWGEDEAVNALTDFFDGGRFVLVTGQFTSAVGLELSDDKRMATLRVFNEVADDAGSHEPRRFSLTWTEGEP